jgi:IS5 family transposase
VIRTHRLLALQPRFGKCGGEKGGDAVGLNPTDRGKSGSKRYLLTDRNGVPLAVVLSSANVHDSIVLEELVDAVEPVRGSGKGRPRKRPEKVHADKGYDFRRCPQHHAELVDRHGRPVRPDRARRCGLHRLHTYVRHHRVQT